MHKSTLLYKTACFLLCLSFNYTFPLHWGLFQNEYSENRTHHCDSASDHHVSTERSKKMVTLESALRNIKDLTQDARKNLYDHINIESKAKNMLSEADVRQYGQLVIMKKYPYLDINELEMKYSPSGKNPRHSVVIGSEVNVANEPSICEPVEDQINVEIINRGLSGVAIPLPLLTKYGLIEKINEFKTLGNKPNVNVITDKSPDRKALGSLKEDINAYMESIKNLK